MTLSARLHLLHGRTAPAALATAGAFALAAAGGAAGGGLWPGAASHSATEPPRVALVAAPAGLDAGGGAQAALDDLRRAEREQGVDGQVRQARPGGEAQRTLRFLAAGGADVVVAVGDALRPAAADASRRFPETRFVVVDGARPAAAREITAAIAAAR